MKKIVMGIAAVAMAASVFAADVSAKVDIDGTLFKFTADSLMQDGQKITKTSGSAFEMNNHSQPWNENMKIAFTDGEGKAGGEFKLSTKGAFDASLMATSYKVWFTPIEGLKFNIGETDIALNKESIDWGTETGVSGNNYSVSYSNSGFSIDLALATDWIKINGKDVWTKSFASDDAIYKAAAEKKKKDSIDAAQKTYDDALKVAKEGYAKTYAWANKTAADYEKDLNNYIKTEETGTGSLATSKSELETAKNGTVTLSDDEKAVAKAEAALTYNKEKADFDKKAADFKPFEIGNTYLKVAYAADFGTIGAFMNASNTFKNIKFGLGYSNNISGINFFVNLYGNVDEMWDISIGKKVSGFKVAGAEIFANGSVDAFSWKVYVKPNMNIETMNFISVLKNYGVSNTLGYGFLDFFGYEAKVAVEYAMGTCTPYANLKVEDKLAKLKEKDGSIDEKIDDSNIAVTLKPGVKGRVGAMQWDVGAEFKVSADPREKLAEKTPGTVDFSVAIPVCLKVEF